MKWIVFILMVCLTGSSWAASVKGKAAKKETVPQQVQQIETSESDQWNQKMCPNEIEDWKVLPTLNPYDSMGRCFEYQGVLFQILDKNKGLFTFISSRTPFAMVDFGKNSLPMTYYSGVVLGKGAYSYKTVTGELKTIFSFISVPKSKEREAWENTKLKEKEKNAEIKISDRRTKVEQEWFDDVKNSNNSELIKNPLILNDPATRLMWARNGNISEKRMEWKEATEWVKTLNYAGHTLWRLPTELEFRKFLKFKNGTSKFTDNHMHKWLNNNGFFNVQEGTYWTSSSGSYGDPTTLDMIWSKISGVAKTNNEKHFVLVVRDTEKINESNYIQQEINQTENVPWNQDKCQNDVEKLEKIINYSPYDINGRCFNYSGRLVQLLDRSQALFSILNGSSPFSLIDFGKDSAPMNYYSGVVQGKGEYSYLSVDGAQKTIYAFVPVKKSNAREVWEVKQEQERKIEEGIAIIAQEKIKAEREKNLTYVDQDTGLMWTTCATMGPTGRKSMFLHDAIEYVENLNYADYDDWRLPTKSELESMAKIGGYFPSEELNKNGFYNVEPYDYWTSSPSNPRYSVYNNNTKIFVIDMFDGSLNEKYQGSSSYIWPVRDTIKKPINIDTPSSIPSIQNNKEEGIWKRSNTPKEKEGKDLLEFI